MCKVLWTNETCGSVNQNEHFPYFKRKQKVVRNAGVNDSSKSFVPTVFFYGWDNGAETLFGWICSPTNIHKRPISQHTYYGKNLEFVTDVTSYTHSRDLDTTEPRDKENKDTLTIIFD